jgi:hypothetical protein
MWKAATSHHSPMYPAPMKVSYFCSQPTSFYSVRSLDWQCAVVPHVLTCSQFLIHLAEIDMSAENLAENSQLAARNPSLQTISRSRPCSRTEKPGEPGESHSCVGYARLCEFSPLCEFSWTQSSADWSAQGFVRCARSSGLR